MSNTQEMAQLIVLHQWKAFGRVSTTDDILDNHYPTVLGWFWDALAYFHKERFYLSLDDVADRHEGLQVYIRKAQEKRVEQHVFRNGRWVHIGSMSETDI